MSNSSHCNSFTVDPINLDYASQRQQSDTHERCDQTFKLQYVPNKAQPHPQLQCEKQRLTCKGALGPSWPQRLNQLRVALKDDSTAPCAASWLPSKPGRGGSLSPALATCSSHYAVKLTQGYLPFLCAHDSSLETAIKLAVHCVRVKVYILRSCEL